MMSYSVLRRIKCGVIICVALVTGCLMGCGGPKIGEHELIDTKIIAPSYIGSLDEVNYDKDYITNTAYSLDYLGGVNVVQYASVSENPDGKGITEEEKEVDTSYGVPVYLVSKNGYDSGISTHAHIVKARGFSYIIANRPITSDSDRDYYITQTAIYLFQDYLHTISGDSHMSNIDVKTLRYINNKKKSIFGGDEKKICEEIMSLYDGAVMYQESESFDYYPVCYFSLSGGANAIFPLFVNDLDGEFSYDPLSNVVHEPLLEDEDMKLGVLASEVIYFEDNKTEYRDETAADNYIDEMIGKYTDSTEVNGFLVVGFESSYEFASGSNEKTLAYDRACKIAEDMIAKGISADDIYICHLNDKFRFGYYYVDSNVDGEYNMDAARMNMYGYIYPVRDTWMASELLSMPYEKYSNIKK